MKWLCLWPAQLIEEQMPLVYKDLKLTMSNYKYVNIKYLRYKTILVLPQMICRQHPIPPSPPPYNLKKHGTWFNLHQYDFPQDHCYNNKQTQLSNKGVRILHNILG